MKSPIDTARGRIVGYDERRQELLVRVPYDDWYTMTKRDYRECLVQLVDSRPLSGKQRRTCYALIGAISDYTGMGKDPTKEYMKLKFLLEDLEGTADQIFSLSNAPMSLVCAFQRFLVRFILDWDIPVKFSLLDMVDDVPDYIYACLASKKCCICGRPACLHHHDRIGSGRDRTEIDQEGMLAEPLCYEHHTECHTMPQAEFDHKYHVVPVKIDAALKRIWRLKGERKRHDKSARRENPCSETSAE